MSKPTPKDSPASSLTFLVIPGGAGCQSLPEMLNVTFLNSTITASIVATKAFFNIKQESICRLRGKYVKTGLSSSEILSKIFILVFNIFLSDLKSGTQIGMSYNYPLHHLSSAQSSFPVVFSHFSIHQQAYRPNDPHKIAPNLSHDKLIKWKRKQKSN